MIRNVKTVLAVAAVASHSAYWGRVSARQRAGEAS